MRKPKEASQGAGSTLRLLSALVDRVAPGQVTLSRTRHDFDGRSRYELVLNTREAKMSWLGSTIAELVDEARDEPADDLDPILPAWRRLKRHQREIVQRTLQELGAHHMAKAAAAQISGDSSAYGSYAIADAFHAAVAELDFIEVDADHVLVARERLDADPPGTLRTTKPKKT